MIHCIPKLDSKNETNKKNTDTPTHIFCTTWRLSYTTPTNWLIYTSRAAYPKSFGGLKPISLQLAHSHLKRSEGYKGCGGQLLAWQSCWLPSDCFKAPKVKARIGWIFWLLELLWFNISILGKKVHEWQFSWSCFSWGNSQKPHNLNSMTYVYVACIYIYFNIPPGDRPIGIHISPSTLFGSSWLMGPPKLTCRSPGAIPPSGVPGTDEIYPMVMEVGWWLR